MASLAPTAMEHAIMQLHGECTNLHSIPVPYEHCPIRSHLFVVLGSVLVVLLCWSINLMV